MTPILITSHAQLDALVAEHCAGWQARHIHIKDGVAWGVRPPMSLHERVPPFSRSADAVLPLLEEHGSLVADRTHLADDGEEWAVSLRRCGSRAVAPTFPLAACLALLRAKGIDAQLSPDFK